MDLSGYCITISKMKPLGNFMGILMDALREMDEKMPEDE